MTAGLDHVVLPTRDLAVARTRLGALGFTVAPQGAHPFGTINACVYFADGTFLEPLAVGDAAVAQRAFEAGNVFVSRDRAYRAAFGDEGFSALVLTSRDADDDHRRFVQAGVSAGPRLDFSRAFLDAEGRSDIASFRLAFASDGFSPGFAFTCERVNAPAVDRSALQRHANGVQTIRAIVIEASDVGRALAFLALVAGADLPENATVLRLPNAALSIVEAAKATGEGFRFQAVAFGVADLIVTRSALQAGGIAFRDQGGQLVAPPAAGQGATFIFEEN